jgi:S1-C subfamily serine protease
MTAHRIPLAALLGLALLVGSGSLRSRALAQQTDAPAGPAPSSDRWNDVAPGAERAPGSLWPATPPPAAATIIRSPVADGLVRSGTAFFIAPNGYALTSAHVVSGCARIDLWPPDGPRHQVQVIATDTADDLALLQVGGGIAPRPPLLGTGRAPVPGEVLSVFGYGTKPAAPREGVLTRAQVVGIATRQPGGRTVLELGAFMHEGNSGAPVVDANGIVQGVIVGRYTERPDISVAPPMSVVDAFLKTAIGDLPPPPAFTGGETPETVLFRIAALIQCTPGIPAGPAVGR